MVKEGVGLPTGQNKEVASKIKGDFFQVSDLVNQITLAEINRVGLEIPTSNLRGRFRVEDVFRSTTSTVMGIDGLVIKVLRNPNQDFLETGQGKVFSDVAGHGLFPWQGPEDNDPKLGILYQQACLEGELLAGVWNNPDEDIYKGIVGVRANEDGEIEVFSQSKISEENNIWPGLVMKRLPTDFNVAKILLDYKAGKFLELTELDIENLCYLSVKAYNDWVIKAPLELVEKYGNLSFFERCLTKETPHQAAEMTSYGWIMQGKNPAEKKIIKAAAEQAERLVQVTKTFLGKYPEYINQVQERVVIGHADSKFSNTIIIAETREAVVEMIKAGVVRLGKLDAQHLAVKPGLMHGQEGVSFAHWRIVPKEQQTAYALMQLVGMGENAMHDRVLAKLEATQDWTENDQIWYLLQLAYKMVGVEPFVNADRYRAGMDGMMKLTMINYPQAGNEIINKLNKLISE